MLIILIKHFFLLEKKKVFTDGQLTKRITTAQRLNDSEVYVFFFELMFLFILTLSLFMYLNILSLVKNQKVLD